MARETVSYRGGYDFDWIQNGVVASGDLLVSAITIATGTGILTATIAAGGAWVKDATNALIRIQPAQQASIALGNSAPATTKYAVIGVEIDTAGVISTVKGTDTATQLNTGSLIASNTPATTSGKLRIADFAIWNNAGTYNFSDHTTTAAQGTNYVDRRPWARGSNHSVIRTSNASAGNDYTTAGTSYAAIDVTNLSQRIECTGVPVRIHLRARVSSSSGALTAQFLPYQDGTVLVGDGSNTPFVAAPTGTGVDLVGASDWAWDFVPSAGSHLFQWYWKTNTGTALLYARAGIPLEVVVEELVKQNSSNGTS